jgi:hypothetical protein
MRVPPIECANPVHGDDDDDGGQDEASRLPPLQQTAGLRETETIP